MYTYMYMYRYRYEYWYRDRCYTAEGAHTHTQSRKERTLLSEVDHRQYAADLLVEERQRAVQNLQCGRTERPQEGKPQECLFGGHQHRRRQVAGSDTGFHCAHFRMTKGEKQVAEAGGGGKEGYPSRRCGPSIPRAVPEWTRSAAPRAPGGPEVRR
jgi:hypothetical protein